MPIYDEKYIKAKVREINGVIKTNFLADEIPKENVHYTCIVMQLLILLWVWKKNNFPQVYLEECKYKKKKTKKKQRWLNS